MSGAGIGAEEAVRLHAVFGAVTGYLRRGFARLQMDRDTALMLAKTVLSGTIAWVLADRVFHAPHATFAPFSAVLLMQVTIADSVQKAVRYTAAMLVGIGLVGALVLPWGVHLWLFPVMLVLGLAIGRWHRLGSQGVNVTVAAIFVYAAFATPQPGVTPLDLLPVIAGLVVLGAAVALTVNLLVAPPLRYRSAEHAVCSFSDCLTGLLSDTVEGLQEGGPQPDQARDWCQQGDQAARMAVAARHTVDHAFKTSKFNPRRILVRDRKSFDGYRVTIDAMERIAGQLASVSTGLLRIAERHGGRPPQQEAFLAEFARLLAAVREAVAAAGRIHTVEDLRGDHGNDALDRTAHDCAVALQELAGQAQGHVLDQPTQWAVYGGLYTDAQRLGEEVSRARDGLHEVADLLQHPRPLRRRVAQHWPSRAAYGSSR